jgi:hypothetical protein
VHYVTPYYRDRISVQKLTITPKKTFLDYTLP